MEIINWLRTSSGDCLLLRRTIDYKDSDTQSEGMSAVDFSIIDEDDWWKFCEDYGDWGTYTQHDGNSEEILKWTLHNPGQDERLALKSKIKTIFDNPSKYIKKEWTMSFWYQDDSDVDHEILYTIVNPNS